MDARIEGEYTVETNQIETYVLFRDAVPKPVEEEAHLRHILRFYMARAMLQQGNKNVTILPMIHLQDDALRVDVAAEKNGKIIVSICEPESVTPETEELLENLKTASDLEVIVVHSQYASPGNIMERFSDELESGKYNLLAVVPPPFDDVYEYDIWMFETTFRNLMEGN